MKEDTRRGILSKLGAGAAMAAVALAAKPAAAWMSARPLMQVGGSNLTIRHGSPKPGNWLRVVITHSAGGGLAAGSVTTVPSQPGDIGWAGGDLVLGIKISAGTIDIAGLNALEGHGFRAGTFGDDASPMAEGRCAVGRAK